MNIIKGMLLVLLLASTAVSTEQKAHPISTITHKIEVVESKEVRWEAFINALIWMESRGIPTAKNPNSSALGLFQQLYIYVDEANRLVGYKKFEYDDRTDPKRSREMFDIVQAHHNPTKDIDRAIRLHAASAGTEQYITKLKAKMYEYIKLNI